MPACQRREPYLITDGCEPPCGCLELNSGPLEEQSVLLTSEPSLQPYFDFFLSFLGFDPRHSLFIYYVYNILSICMPASQKRALDFIIDGCEPPCGCWELNSGPLEEQSVSLTSEPSLQPYR